ncbi:MAG: DUF3120 domain-containing protein, partial [Chloroflexaceae bacterium]|nr:DUF3120 domain-containing protein [Chloroflexaceae bacterium]
PVFVQAPLVRFWPWVSLLLTAGWLAIALRLRRQPQTYLWGDLLLGFSWSWLAGSLYWGWFRAEPLVHLPIEAIGLPLALWGLRRGWGLVGNCFYLGSLVGTAITDIYFYLTDLIPFWRAVMQVPPPESAAILHQALAKIQCLWGISWAVVLVNVLLALGLGTLQEQKLHWQAFSGAVLTTLVVDGLFWLVASLA